MSARRIFAVGLALVSVAAAVPRAQTTAPAEAANPTDASRLWMTVGGSATTLRGDCQEDCIAHGTGSYVHTGRIFGTIGSRLNPQMDAGIELSWVPATTGAGDDTRSTFLLGTAQFKPWASRGLFLNAGMGMAFIRNFGLEGPETVPPVTSRALGLTYGIGWTFRHTERIAFQMLGTQHLAALGDFESAGVVLENVMVNYWSIGGAIVIR